MRHTLLSSSVAILLAGCATSQPTPPASAAAPARAPVEVNPTGTPGQAGASRLERARATVKAVDVATRTVTLQNTDGTIDTVKAGPEVKRLAEIAPGDVVDVEFQQGLLLDFQPAGSETVPPQLAGAAARTSADEPPGGAAAAGVRGTVTVTSIDSASRVVALQGPGGQVYEVKAGPAVKLEKLKVGDRLLATYVETLVVTLDKATTK